MNKTVNNTNEIDSKTCRICGGEGKPSKGIRNYHHRDKSFRRGEIEFETKLIKCTKCTDCGHSWS